MRGYRAIADWAKSLGKNARQRFGCRYQKGRYLVPSEYIIRDVLMRIDPLSLDRALQRWNEIHAEQDESLAIDGKTMCNAIDEQGHRTHIMSVVGHQMDVFLFEPETDRYLGRLCSFSQCPKGKRDCLVPGCGAIAFNKRIAEFTPRADLLAPAQSAMLYRRGAGRLRSALDLPTVAQDQAPRA